MLDKRQARVYLWFTMKRNYSKATCPRCSGSGHFSFNLIHGTVCFQCNGAGVVLVDLKAQARNKKAQEIRSADTAARRQLMSETYQQVIREMNVIHQVDSIDTELGIDRLNRKVWETTGKTIAQIRDERVK